MTDKEALKLALEVNESMKDVLKQVNELIAENKSLKEALAQEKALQALHSENERLGLYKDAYAQPEPVAWMDADGNVSDNNDHKCFPIPLYTTPPQRTWVDLTRTQIQDVYFAVLEEHRGNHQMQGQLAFGEALQAKIKERNT
jgi:hypothetical protein